eukprot:SAG22_NODE_434_length_10555_cov_3.917559_3_plen_226_part_00
MLEAGRGWVLKMREEMELAEKAAEAAEAAEIKAKLIADAMGGGGGSEAGDLLGDAAGGDPLALEDGGGGDTDMFAGVALEDAPEPEAPEPEAPEPEPELSQEAKASELATLSVLVVDEEQSAAIYIQARWRRRAILKLRAWAASKIQAAWRGYKIRKEAKLIASLQAIEDPDGDGLGPLSGLERDMATQFGHALVRTMTRPPPGQVRAAVGCSSCRLPPIIFCCC